MADRPILFSAPMVRALLAGRKSQTRRIVKDRIPLSDLSSEQQEHLELRSWDVYDGHLVKLPAFAGDRLWVREAWAAGACAGDMPPSCLAPRFWRVENGGLWYRAGGEPAHPITPRGKWRSPIHMPSWASRLTLTVTDVRVQRLQEISGMDAKAEGVDIPAHMPEDGADLEHARRAFRTLWESIHGTGSWDANPWVAAISFTVEGGR